MQDGLHPGDGCRSAPVVLDAFGVGVCAAVGGRGVGAKEVERVALANVVAGCGVEGGFAFEAAQVRGVAVLEAAEDGADVLGFPEARFFVLAGDGHAGRAREVTAGRVRRFRHGEGCR